MSSILARDLRKGLAAFLAAIGLKKIADRVRPAGGGGSGPIKPRQQ